jgi:hypothetical protein
MGFIKLESWQSQAARSEDVFNFGYPYCDECSEPEYQYPEPDLLMFEDDGLVLCEGCKDKEPNQ